MKEYMPQSLNRLFCLDLLKAVSITAVVSYHAIFVPRSSYESSLLALDVLSAPLRFCVPVLFTISFLLLERGLAKPSQAPTWKLLQKRLLRLAIPTGAWFGLAIGLKLLKGTIAISELPAYILRGDAYLGAYYLIVLFQFLLIFIWLRQWFRYTVYVLFALLLQGSIFLLTYQASSGMTELQSLLSVLRSLGRSPLIYWFAYAALGVYFYKNWSRLVQISQKISPPIKLVLVLLISLLLMFENYWLFTLTDGKIVPFDYNMFACVISAIVAFLCVASINAEQLPKSVQPLVALLSRYSLGIFCINGILSEVFLSLGSNMFGNLTLNLFEVLLMKLVGWIVLLGISLQLSILLDRIGLGAIVR